MYELIIYRENGLYYASNGFNLKIDDINNLKNVSDMINKYEKYNKIVINNIYKKLDTHSFTEYKPLNFRKFVDRHIEEDYLINLGKILSKKFEKQ